MVKGHSAAGIVWVNHMAAHLRGRPPGAVSSIRASAGELGGPTNRWNTLETKQVHINRNEKAGFGNGTETMSNIRLKGQKFPGPNCSSALRARPAGLLLRGSSMPPPLCLCPHGRRRHPRKDVRRQPLNRIGGAIRAVPKLRHPKSARAQRSCAHKLELLFLHLCFQVTATRSYVSLAGKKLETNSRPVARQEKTFL